MSKTRFLPSRNPQPNQRVRPINRQFSNNAEIMECYGSGEEGLLPQSRVQSDGGWCRGRLLEYQMAEVLLRG